MVVAVAGQRPTASARAAAFLHTTLCQRNDSLDHMTLRSRLAAGLVTIAILLVGPLVFAEHSVFRLNDEFRALRDRDLAASLLLGQLREGLDDLRQLELGLLFTKTPDARDAMEKQVAVVHKLADS